MKRKKRDCPVDFPAIAQLEQELAREKYRRRYGRVLRSTIYTLIGTHHLSHMSILYQVLECWHICLPQVAWRHIVYICHVAAPFRTAVYGIVLGTSKQFAVFCRLRSLQSSHHGLPHK